MQSLCGRNRHSDTSWMKSIMEKQLKIYLTALIGLLLSSCSGLKTTISENGIEVSDNGINKKQYELIFENTKSFPKNTHSTPQIIPIPETQPPPTLKSVP